MMIKKRWIKTLFVLLAVLLAAGCQDTDKKEEAKDQADGNKEVYQFVDVLGQQYEAELLEAVPKNTYDLKRIKKKDGYQHYTDEAGNIISKVGIDVSEYQPSVDWAKVKASGIDFAIIRVGFRGYGQEGKLVEDAMFKSHIEGALAAGLDVGVYFFSQATSVAEAEEEAGYVLNLLQNKKPDYPVFFDWEIADVEGSRSASATGEQITSFASAFCKKISKAGFKAGVYFNRHLGYDYYNLETIKDFDFWLAEYQSVPAFYYDFKVWQYSDNAQVQGISTPVDINISFKKYA